MDRNEDSRPRLVGAAKERSRSGTPPVTLPWLVFGALSLVALGAPAARAQTAVLAASGDTYLKSGSPNQSQGNETILRVQSSGHNRALVQFDPSAITAAVESGSLVSAHLELFIASNPGNWGPEGRTVDAHRLTELWSESGATWNCPVDANPANGSPDCLAEWNGGAFEEEPSDNVLHTGELTDWISFEVTADVAAFLGGGAHHGWLVKKTEEGQNGRVEYASGEAGAGNGPRLVLVVESAEHDETPPRLAITSPEDPVVVNHPSPTIAVEYSDGGSGVDPGTLSVLLDQQDVTATCNVGAAQATCAPGILGSGPHTVEVSLLDQAGNLASATLAFELLTGPGLHTLRLPIAADTYLKQGTPNQNQGDETILRVRQSGKNRSLLRLDPAEVASLLAGATVHSARLELFIADNGNNWGVAGRTVDLHRLTALWSELGATWNCADDSEPSNHQPDCNPEWSGGSFDAEPTASLLVTNGLAGSVDFDVTAEISAMAEGAAHEGWLLKKSAEGQSGRIEFVSREGVPEEQPGVVVVFETAGGGDTTPPVITPVTPGPDGFVPISRPDVSASFSDEQSGVDSASARIIVDGADVTLEATVSAEGIAWEPAEPLVEGPHVVEVTLADIVGNPAAVTWTFTVDLTAPSLEVAEPTEAVIIGSATPAVLLVYDDLVSGLNLVSLDLRVDGVDMRAFCAIGDVSASCTTPPLQNGAHTVSAQIRDRAGNEQVASKTFELVLDTEAPVVGITTPEDGVAINTPAVAVNGTATDNGSLASVSVNGVEAMQAGEQFTATVALEEGFNRLLAVATDLAGNQGIASRGAILDTVPPQIELETPPPGQVVNGGVVRVAGRVLDARGVASVRVNNEDAALADGRFVAEVSLVEGSNLLTVVAADSAGNTREATTEVTRFSLPEVAITSPQDLAFIAATTVSVAGTVSEGVASVVVNGVPASLEGTTFQAVGVPLIEGGNTVTATATGPLGRVATATIHVVRDLTPPRVEIYRPAAGRVVHEPTVAVSGLVNDIVPGTVNATEATVTVNGVPAQVSNRSFFVPEVALLPGENTIQAVAVDESGNTADVEVTVRLEPPAGPRLRVIFGNHQTAAIGTTLPDPLVVEVLDAGGQPVVGQPVVFSLRGNNGVLEDGRRWVVAVTDAAGRAESHFTLGGRAGVANQVVEASATGFAGPAVFTASALPASPDSIVVDSGGLQVGIAGRSVPRPLIAAVIDSGHNRSEGVAVRFQVVKGAGHFPDGSQEKVVATDSDGRAIVTFTLDAEEGIGNNVVVARVDGLDEGPVATFVASGRAAGAPEDTSISGVVLDNTNRPIAGATLRVKQTLLTAETDEDGQFRIDGAPVGAVKLIVDGSTVDRPGSWPDLEYDLVTVPGRDNTVNMPIFLLPLDLGSGLFIDETHGGTLSLPDYPSFALEIAPGSVTFPGGGRSGQVSVTVVHNDKVPMVPNFGQQPRMIVTIQPAGARFEPPARLTLPNVEGLAAGEVTEMYSFDHDLGHFVSIGPATVSDDATRIVADPGVGIVKAGWHCGGNPSSTGATHDCPPCTFCNGSACVPGCSLSSNLVSSSEAYRTVFAGAGDCPCDDGDSCTVDDQCGGGGSCAPGERKEILSVTPEAQGPSDPEIFIGDTVQFTAEVEERHCETLTYLWDLGDGTTAGGESTSHAYDTPGTYSVSLEVNCETCDSMTEQVTVTVKCPDVQITDADPDVEHVCPGCQVQYTATTNPSGRTVYWSVRELFGGMGGTATIDSSGLLSIAEDAPEGAVAVKASGMPDGSACSDTRGQNVFVPVPDPKPEGGATKGEKAWAWRNKKCAFWNALLRFHCDKAPENNGMGKPLDGTKPNAWQHAYCACVSASRCGRLLARELSEVHEDWIDNPCTHSTMDLHNNEIGIQVSTGDEDQCADLVTQALNDGRLRWMNPVTKVGCPTFVVTP